MEKMSITTRVFLALSLAGFLVPNRAQVQDVPASAKDDALARFLAELEKQATPTKSLRILLTFRGNIPDPQGGNALTMKALLRLESLEEDADQRGASADEQATGAGKPLRWSRLDVDLTTAQGSLRTEKVRSPDGIKIHQASELTGERWLSIDRATMERLDKAARVLGTAGALPIQGDPTPSAVVGADLVRGLSRAYALEPGEDVEIDGQACMALRGKLRGAGAADVGDVPRERPDEVQLFFSKKTRLLVRMLQFQAGSELYAVHVRDVDFAAPLQKSRFVLTPPKGVRFVDVFDDELGSLRLRMELERLDAWERDQKRAGNGDGKDR